MQQIAFFLKKTIRTLKQRAGGIPKSKFPCFAGSTSVGLDPFGNTLDVTFWERNSQTD
jgi:hypothetical protein